MIDGHRESHLLLRGALGVEVGDLEVAEAVEREKRRKNLEMGLLEMGNL